MDCGPAARCDRHETEEAFGLKWSDIDWQKGQINIRRGWSKGKETAGKTKVSMTRVQCIRH